MLILAIMIIRILPAILNFFLLKIVTVRITTAVFQKLVDKFFSLLIRHSRLRNDLGPSELVCSLYNLIAQFYQSRPSDNASRKWRICSEHSERKCVRVYGLVMRFYILPLIAPLIFEMRKSPNSFVILTLSPP
jgi:hypothetical protein